MVEISLNINCKVKVRLTTDGEKTYRQHHIQLGMGVIPLNCDAEGWREFQMWDLMNIFGSQCFNGGRQQFVENRVHILGQRL